MLYFHDHCLRTGSWRRDEGVHTFGHVLKRDGKRLRVFLHAWPSDANDLPTDRRRFGFDALIDFRPGLLGWRQDGKCYAVCRLPDYDIARVHTGWAMKRSTGKGPRYDVVWEGSFSPVRAAGGVLRSPQPVR